MNIPVEVIAEGLQARLKAAGLEHSDVFACADHARWHRTAREVLGAVLVLLPESFFRSYVQTVVDDRSEYEVAPHRKARAHKLVDESISAITHATGQQVGFIRARNLVTARIEAVTSPEVRAALEDLRREIVAQANAVQFPEGGDNGA